MKYLPTPLANIIKDIKLIISAHYSYRSRSSYNTQGYIYYLYSLVSIFTCALSTIGQEMTSYLSTTYIKLLNFIQK